MLSILIVTWRTRDLLDACLASIRQYPPSRPYEVIVVDNDPADGTSSMVKSKYPEAILIDSGGNVGYAEGNNIAFARASGDFLLTLNPDTEVTEGTFEKSIERLKAHPKFGCLGIKLVGIDGKTQSSVRGFPTALALFGEITGLGRTWPNSPLGSYRLSNFDYDREQPGPQPMGTYLLFRREALARVGDIEAPFDPSFPIFFNEVDLLYRLDKAGWPTLYTPATWVRHHGGESTKQVRKSMIWESHRSLLRYLWKHHGKGLGAVGLWGLSAVVYAAAFVRARGYDAGFRVKRHHL
jgi:hypothetical protein